ncbi:recombinase family protein [Aequorivita echinoideorum]|uniref:Recombinase family protein n=1 Tax=Aequorivita echinoideorum TaxID=1549647 RepID=A0ABS5S0U3_9FLAO|nr:recombinase family protein [Aequorivita echinoideorum]MBT0606829.1 recombinase family protein [Aequorivita echinoideorum]
MNYISYIRVSTTRQGISGLGLQAQKSAVKNFLKPEDNLLVEFQEVESGKNNERTMLKEAIQRCKEMNATLLIAKLDRLSRNVSFIYTLRDSKIDFVCADMPNASPVTIGIMAVLAQDERERISQRTKSALEELKSKGVKLGKPENLSDFSRKRSLQVRQEKANNNINNRLATALIVSMRKENKSYSIIAEELNASGYKTRRNKNFSAMSVKRLYDRHSVKCA